MKQILLILILTAMIWNDLISQDRQPAVAGQFYPADPQELKHTVLNLFAQAKPKEVSNTQAIISPHAGYIFSGQVAASAYNQIDTDRDYDNIFLIGTSHVAAFQGASIYAGGDYIMPFGKIKVNTNLAKELIDKYDFFSFQQYVHQPEHSLEVQLPFLYYKLEGKDFKIVPIIIGTNKIGVIKQIAQALKPYFNEKNLFIISTDFSHYPPYDYAVKIDKRTAEAIASKDPNKFLSVIEENKQLNVPNLATSICGWSSVLTLMYLAEDNPNLEFKLIDYKNSGDAAYKMTDQVVGYYAIALIRKINSQKKTKLQQSKEFSLTDNDKQILLSISRQTLEQYIIKKQIPQFDPANFSKSLQIKAGAFVTLKKDDKLRGCIGRFFSDAPLWKVVQDMTIAAATQDPRFPSVKPDELNDIVIEISVLSPLKRVNSPDEVIVGKHGVYCQQGIFTGTLLPQVAVEQGWDAYQFVEYCCKYKANLEPDCWKNGELYVYEALVFDETEFKH